MIFSLCASFIYLILLYMLYYIHNYFMEIFNVIYLYHFGNNLNEFVYCRLLH